METSEKIKRNETDRIVKVMVDNTAARYIRMIDLASTDSPPQKGILSVDKVDNEGNAHVGDIGFEVGVTCSIDFSKVVRQTIYKLVCRKTGNTPIWLTKEWIESVRVAFSDYEEILCVGF